MRRAVLSALLVAAALVLQLTVVNGLSLPGGGVPDLVLLVVVALALCGGPQQGMLTGFCGGLALDLAPPGSQLIGGYALVFCVVGYGCGRLRGTPGSSALLPLVIAAVAAAAGEVLYAALGLALDPTQVTWAAVRQVLPASVLFDVVLSSLVLPAVMLASSWVDDRAGGGLPEQRRAGRSALSGPATSAARGVPRLGRAAARQGDSWIGGRPPTWRAPAGQQARRRATPRLRPGAGFGGTAARTQSARSQPGRSQSGRGQPGRLQLARTQLTRTHLTGAQPAGTQPARTQPGRPVNLRLAAGRRRDQKARGAARGARGAAPRIAFAAGRGRGIAASWSAATGGGTGRGTGQPGAGRPARGRGFRPAAGSRGGSAANGRSPRPPAAQPVRLRLHAPRRRDGVIGGGMLTARGPRVFGGRRQAMAARFRPGGAARSRPDKTARFRSGRRSGRGSGAARFRPDKTARFRSGRRSALSFWTLGIAGRRSSARRIGSNRPGGHG